MPGISSCFYANPIPMKSLFLLCLLVLAGVLAGCSSEAADNTKETKPEDVKLDMTDEQKAEISKKFDNPNWKKR